MRKLVFTMNVSLDGCADHRVAVADDELHDFSTDFLESVDTILFGRAAYLLLEGYWPVADEDPRATESMLEFARRINAMPKVVFSRTLRNAAWNNTQLVKKDAVETVQRMKREKGGTLSVGGIQLIQTFLNLRMIDEFWLLVQPLVWGEGRRLFDGVDDRLDFKLVDSRTFKSGVVVLHYIPG
ncbi:MAG TPA: dihydrofolate reductase family protein [Anaerolineales bacterium]|nr:dihydrofolate reductase family protein [Anaerolineales bacterium]